MSTRTKARGPAVYKGPYGTPLAHVQYREGRHLVPERIPFRKFETATTIKLLDVSKESLDNLKKVAATIKRLLAPSLKLQTVPEPLVAYLERLERLDLGHNRLTDASFPDSMKTLESLIELRLNNNRLTRLPTCLRRLRNLSRLDLSNNQLETATGMEKLKKMQILVLDSNRLSSVFKEVSSLRKLEMLRCSSNQLRDVPRDIRNLRHLRDLDISQNRIVLLPIDVFQLPKLECLNASQNQVAKVPTFNVKVQNKHWMKSVDLSDNNLVKFPAHLLQLTRKLDLGANKIKTLSWTALRKMDHDGDQELLLDANPITFPPADVCESGLRNIVKFFQESQADVKTYQGVKVLVIGSHRSGKTSLIHSLVDHQTRLADDVTETAAGIDAYEMSFDYDVEDGKPGKSLNLCLWDFCGDPFYLYPHYIFHEQPAITVLTFSMPDYSPDNFSQQIGSWFDWMIAKTNKLVVILVGTQSDRVSAKKAGEITREIREKLAAHLQKRQSMVESRIKQIEQMPVISPTLSDQLKAYMKLLQAKLTVQTEVITTSCQTFQGFDKIREAIERLASDQKLFPNVMRVIPTFWVEVENWVEERGNSMVVPVMLWDEYSQGVTERYGMKHLLGAITQYLHDTGKVLWFSNVPSLKGTVFLRPSWLFDVLKQLFRHDLDSVTYTPDDTLKAIAFTPAKFERLKQELLAEGVVDRELLKGLLVSLVPADLSKPSWEVLQILTEGLEMGYPVAKRSKDRHYTFGIERDTEGKLKIPKLLIPWFRRSAEPASFRETWAALQDRRHVAALFKFPCYMPPGLFEILTVRAYSEKHKLVFLSHWGGGVHARHSEEKVHVLVTYYRENPAQAERGPDEEEEEAGARGGEEERGIGGASEEVSGGGVRTRGTPSQHPGLTSPPAQLTGSLQRRRGASDERHDSDIGAAVRPKARSIPVIPLIRTDSADSLDSVKSDDSETSSPSSPSSSPSPATSSSFASKHRPRRGAEQSPVWPQTIEEIDEELEGAEDNNNDPYDEDEVEVEDDASNAKLASFHDQGGGKAERTENKSTSTRANLNTKAERTENKSTSTRANLNTMANGASAVSGRHASGPTVVIDNDGRAVVPEEDVPKTKRTLSRTRPTANDCSEEDNIVLKLEVRDQSEDKQDQTPASSMWNILLPILMDFEELLQGYAGVLVERRTECPICGEASFLGEWLTPKETQGMNERTCEACNQHVDTAFLVQPREKKRVVINRNRFKRPLDLLVENGEGMKGDMTSCGSSSDAASNDVVPQ